ncbi:unnamed protein product (macronuclear) [Paramecium tetraurelia]|uniref:Cleavage/polyadenylation specificity factor A subunit N-terminal domain-containing protein n=1 Tax=Paramecium tetraurelia TaxID=5888 RepID=A0CCY1_PARTE|nr:uncharacterized protein GSPATT00037433001 [Paramecium tetraurelia]CAK68648.1 unnamed protein product [Paramecium tetraurelia]|eukprot:XP_001436045.1 hypothetical protein (macronuclear) [Paramecium tetraurelia strain d4-2]
MQFIPVMKACSLVEGNFLNLYGVENEIIYYDIREFFSLEQENFLSLEPQEIVKNIKIINTIEQEYEIPLQLESHPRDIRLGNKFNQNLESTIIIIDEEDQFYEYSLISQQLVKFQIPDYHLNHLDLVDGILLNVYDKKYIIIDESTIAQTYLMLFEEVFYNQFEIKQQAEYVVAFQQNGENNKLFGVGNTIYRINYNQIQIYQIEQDKLNLKGFIKKSQNNHECGPLSNIIKAKIHQNSISFIDSNTLVIVQLIGNINDEINQKCIKFNEEIYNYDYYEFLDEYVVVTHNQLVFGNQRRDLNIQAAKHTTNVFLTQNNILFVLSSNIELYSKELKFLDVILNQNQFVIEVIPETDQFISIDKSNAKLFHLIQSPMIRINKQNEDIDFQLNQITEQDECTLNVHFSVQQINYNNLFEKLKNQKLVPSTAWKLYDCNQKQNQISTLEQLIKENKAKLIVELPSLSQKEYILIREDQNEFTLIVQQQKVNSYEQYQFKLEIQDIEKSDNQLWWVLDDEVYFTFHLIDRCYIFRLDYGIENLMFHKEITLNYKLLKVVSSGNYLFILGEQKANINVLLYSSISDVQQEQKKIQLPTIKDIFASPLQKDYLIIKMEKQLVVYHLLIVPQQIFKEIVKPSETNVIIFKKYFVVLMKSSDEKEKICEVYFFKSTQKIEKLGRSPMEQFSQIQIQDTLVQTSQNVFYLKCQVKLEKIKRNALVAFKVGKSIYNSLMFILLRNKNSEYQVISDLLLKQNSDQLMPMISIRNNEMCLIQEDDEKIIDFEPLKDEDLNLVDGDDRPPIVDNSGDIDQDNRDDQNDDDNTLDLESDEDLPIGSFLVMSTIEEALIYSLFRTFGRRRVETIDIV